MVFPLFAGFYYWAPVFNGHRLSERCGALGLRADVRRLQPRLLPDAHRRACWACRGASYTYADGLGWNLLNLLSTARRLRVRRGRAAVPRRRWRARCAGQQQDARQPVERRHARVAAAARLRRAQHPAGRTRASRCGTSPRCRRKWRPAATGCPARPSAAARRWSPARVRRAAPAPAAPARRRLVAVRRGGRHGRLLPAADGGAGSCRPSPAAPSRDRGHPRAGCGARTSRRRRPRPGSATASTVPAGATGRASHSWWAMVILLGGGRDDLRVARLRARACGDGAGRLPAARRARCRRGGAVARRPCWWPARC